MTTDGKSPLLAWSDLWHEPAVTHGNVLDLRATGQFAAGHLVQSASLPLEPDLAKVAATALTERLGRLLPSIYLPPRHEPLLVVAADAALAEAVSASLRLRGRPLTTAVAYPSGATPEAPPGALATGPSSHTLWAPPPFLERWVHLLPPPAAGPVLDLACGSGRAGVWLAQRGWRVTGIDHQPEALSMAGQLAASSGVRLHLRAADLRRPDSLPAGPWSAVLLFRYLDRALLRRLPGHLSPGAVVMLRTFRDAPGYVGNPQPRHRLRPSEAAAVWRQESARVLVHEEGFDPDGRPAAGSVVQWQGGDF